MRGGAGADRNEDDRGKVMCRCSPRNREMRVARGENNEGDGGADRLRGDEMIVMMMLAEEKKEKK